MRLRLNQYFKKGSVSDEYSLHSRENTPQMLGDTGSACGSKLRLIRFHLESKYDQHSGSMAPLGVCSCLGLVGLLCGVKPLALLTTTRSPLTTIKVHRLHEM